MGLRLTVDRDEFTDHVRSIGDSFPGLIHVVKGNGYGLGRAVLFPIAARISDTIAVGTVYEAVGTPPDDHRAVVRPHRVSRLPPELAPGAVLTVGSLEHVDAL